MKIRKLFFLLSGLILLNTFCNGQAGIKEIIGPDGIQWMNFEDALKQQKTNPKKIFIDVYTGWCGWCKKMDGSTFKDQKVVDYLNSKFYAVKLDAETKDTITYKSKDYTFVPAYKSNEVAAFLLNGKMSYPTSLYLDEKSDPITAVPGFLTGEQLLPILKYFGEDIYKTKTWEDYQKESPK